MLGQIAFLYKKTLSCRDLGRHFSSIDGRTLVNNINISQSKTTYKIEVMTTHWKERSAMLCFAVVLGGVFSWPGERHFLIHLTMKSKKDLSEEEKKKLNICDKKRLQKYFGTYVSQFLNIKRAIKSTYIWISKFIFYKYLFLMPRILPPLPLPIYIDTQAIGLLSHLKILHC